MDFHILGSLEVVDEGRVVTVGGSKPQALLALLLVHRNETLSTERLIEELWGARRPASPVKNLQVHVSRLRKALANGNGAGAVLVTRHHGYQLKLDPERLDAHRFERLVAEGRAELASGRPERALATLERGLSLWRGPALADVADEPFAEREAARLGELRIGAIEELIDAKLELGRHAEVLGELEALIAEHPYRERLRAQKMLALYRSDRQADALQAYQDARIRLVKDLGIEPGERLRRLEQAVLAQDPALLPTPAERTQLPAELDAGTPLAGRDEEVRWLREHWRRALAGGGRLVLLSGEHGIGKTRLAAQLAVEAHSAAAEVRYDSGEGAATRARAMLADDWPTLLVLDDVESLDGLADAVRGRPVLVVATAVRPVPGADAALGLLPLDVDAVRAVARAYVREGVEVPAERLAAASGGIPQRVHRLSRAWAHDAAAARLGSSASRTEEERGSLRAMEAELVDNVVELRALDQTVGDRVVACPFKGLASFDVDDADVFFGRERLVAELVARLVGAPLLGIVGASGSGKSSALRAGLLAALRAGVLPGSDRWRLRLLRPGEHPPAALGEFDGEDRTTIVAVDQFEEVFTACRDEAERAAFVERLVAGAHDPRTVVIVAIRADFYGRCGAYPGLAHLLAANHVLVGPMRRDELRSAIEAPARRAGLTVDSELVDALVSDVDGEPGALPLLSTALLELWRDRDGRRLRFGAYEHSGGVQGAVGRLAESAYGRLDDEQREIARRMLLRLAGDGEGHAVVRRRVDLGELIDERDGAAVEVLSVLTESRLVTVGERQVEVAHEALLREWPRLRGWLEEDVQGRHLHRHLSVAAREWDARGREAGELYRGARLASALDWSAGHERELNAVERAFLEQSLAASERAHRRLRAVLAGVAALLVVALLAGLVALDQRGNARAEAVAADAQKLGASALVDNDFGRALLLARQAVALDETVQTRGNLLATLLKSPAAIGVMRAGADKRFWSAALSPDGRTLAAGDEFGRVVLFDVRSRRPLATIDPLGDGATIFTLVYSADGRHLALASGLEGGIFETATVLDMRTRRVVAKLTDLQGVVGTLRFSDHGRVLAVDVIDKRPPAPEESYLMRFDLQSNARRENRVQISEHPALAWTTGDGRRLVASDQDETSIRTATGQQVLRRFPQGFGGDDFWTAVSRDGRTLAAGGQDGTLRLMDLRTGDVRTASGRHGAPVSRGIVFTRDGRRVITPGEDGAVVIWDVATATAVETLTGHGGPARALAVSDDGDTLYSAGADGSVLIWDLAGDRRLGRPFDAGRPSRSFPRYAISSDGRLLAHGQADGNVTVVDARTFAVRRSFPVTTVGKVPIDPSLGIPVPEVAGMSFVPRSHLLVVAGTGGFLVIVDADSGRVLKRLSGHADLVWTPGISADGRLMVTGSGDGTMRLWSLPDGRARGAPIRLDPSSTDVQLSADGRWIAVADATDTVRIFDARSRRLAHRVKGQEGIMLARFSPDGRLLAVGDTHGHAAVWSTATWKPITRAFAGHNGTVDLAAINPDDRTLATGARDGIVRLWDIETQQPLGTALPGLPGQRVIPLFTPDGSGLIAAYANGRAYRWDIRTASLIRQACRVAGRRLTPAEWEEFLPGRDYDPAC